MKSQTGRRRRRFSAQANERDERDEGDDGHEERERRDQDGAAEFRGRIDGIAEAAGSGAGLRAADGVQGVARGRDRAAGADGGQPAQPLGQADHHAGGGDDARRDGDRRADQVEHVIDAGQVIGGDFRCGRDGQRDEDDGLAQPVESARGLDVAEMDREPRGEQRHEGAKAGRGREREPGRDRQDDAQGFSHSWIRR